MRHPLLGTVVVVSISRLVTSSDARSRHRPPSRLPPPNVPPPAWARSAPPPTRNISSPLSPTPCAETFPVWPDSRVGPHAVFQSGSTALLIHFPQSFHLPVTKAQDL